MESYWTPVLSLIPQAGLIVIQNSQHCVLVGPIFGVHAYSVAPGKAAISDRFRHATG